MTTLAILTNSRAADQRSMIGYGEMLLEAARRSGHEVVEFPPRFALRAVAARACAGGRRPICPMQTSATSLILGHLIK